MDIVEKLRQITVGISITQAAADTIETLRARVAELERLQLTIDEYQGLHEQLAAVTRECAGWKQEAIEFGKDVERVTKERDYWERNANESAAEMKKKLAAVTKERDELREYKAMCEGLCK